MDAVAAEAAVAIAAVAAVAPSAAIDELTLFSGYGHHLVH
jgi:hypothetical protein